MIYLYLSSSSVWIVYHWRHLIQPLYDPVFLFDWLAISLSLSLSLSVQAMFSTARTTMTTIIVNRAATAPPVVGTGVTVTMTQSGPRAHWSSRPGSPSHWDPFRTTPSCGRWAPCWGPRWSWETGLRSSPAVTSTGSSPSSWPTCWNPQHLSAVRGELRVYIQAAVTHRMQTNCRDLWHEKVSYFNGWRSSRVLQRQRRHWILYLSTNIAFFPSFPFLLTWAEFLLFCLYCSSVCCFADVEEILLAFGYSQAYWVCVFCDCCVINAMTTSWDCFH